MIEILRSQAFSSLFRKSGRGHVSKIYLKLLKNPSEENLREKVSS